MPELKDTEAQAVAIGELMRTLGLDMAAAESCTAGLVTAALADAAGASAWLRGGMVTYDTKWKEDYLNVRHSTVEEHDVVSEPVVQEMLEGVHTVFGVPVAVAVSGYAGPTSGNPDIPAGTVVIGVSVRDSDFRADNVQTRFFDGDRSQVRHQAVEVALSMLHDMLADDLASRERACC